MPDPVITSEGVAVVHLFCSRTAETDDDAVIAAVEDAQAVDVQVVTVAILGHKAELCFMALHADSWKIRDLQTGLRNAGYEVFAGTGYRGFYEKRKSEDPDFSGVELAPDQEFAIVVGPKPPVSE